MRKNSIVVALLAIALLTGCSDELPLEVGEADSSATIDRELGATQASPYSRELSTKFSEPWPTDVTRVELASSAIYKSFEFLDTLGNTDCKVKAVVYAGDPVLEEHRALLREIADRMVETYCDYMTRDIYVIGGSYDFLEKTIKEENIPGDIFKACPRPAQEWAMACAYQDIAWTGISLGSSKQGNVFVEDRRVTIASHELFHLVHDQMDPDAGGQTPGPDQPNFRPIWLNEGAGEMIGRLMPYYFGIIDFYGTFVPTDRYGLPVDKNYLGDLKKMEIRQRVADGLENYYAGQVAMEYIIASVGMDSLLDIWVEMGKGKNFETAFESATGINKREFYKLFKEMHANLYEGDLATN